MPSLFLMVFLLYRVMDVSISPDSVRAIRWSGSRIFSGAGAATGRAGTRLDSGATVSRRSAAGGGEPWA